MKKKEKKEKRKKKKEKKRAFGTIFKDPCMSTETKKESTSLSTRVVPMARRILEIDAFPKQKAELRQSSDKETSIRATVRKSLKKM